MDSLDSNPTEEKTVIKIANSLKTGDVQYLKIKWEYNEGPWIILHMDTYLFVCKLMKTDSEEKKSLLYHINVIKIT